MIIDGIDYGHNCPPDTGATGWMQEDDGTKDVGEKVVYKLSATSGHKGVCVTPLGQTFSSVIGSLGKRCQIANNLGVNRYVSIHMNAANGNAHGVEIFANSEAARQMAQPILDNLVALGFTNRGIKSENLYVLRNTTAPAILIEICFCDSEIDRAIYSSENIANVIVAGLTGQNAVSIPAPTPIQKQVFGTTWQRDIAELQHLLNVQGYRDRNNNKLVEDGYVGDLTLSALQRCIIKRGASGEITKWVQKRLCITQDGSYGNPPYHEMYDAVINFQKNNSLLCDGCIGLQTWAKLVQK